MSKIDYTCVRCGKLAENPREVYLAHGNGGAYGIGAACKTCLEAAAQEALDDGEFMRDKFGWYAKGERSNVTYKVVKCGHSGCAELNKKQGYIVVPEGYAGKSYCSIECLDAMPTHTPEDCRVDDPCFKDECSRCLGGPPPG